MCSSGDRSFICSFMPHLGDVSSARRFWSSRCGTWEGVLLASSATRPAPRCPTPGVDSAAGRRRTCTARFFPTGTCLGMGTRWPVTRRGPWAHGAYTVVAEEAGEPAASPAERPRGRGCEPGQLEGTVPARAVRGALIAEATPQSGMVSSKTGQWLTRVLRQTGATAHRSGAGSGWPLTWAGAPGLLVCLPRGHAHPICVRGGRWGAALSAIL